MRISFSWVSPACILRPGLTTGDYEEACIKRAFSGRAAETVVLASPEEINTASAFVTGDLSLVNTLVVENTTDERWERYERKGRYG